MDELDVEEYRSPVSSVKYKPARPVHKTRSRELNNSWVNCGAGFTDFRDPSGGKRKRKSTRDREAPPTRGFSQSTPEICDISSESDNSPIKASLPKLDPRTTLPSSNIDSKRRKLIRNRTSSSTSMDKKRKENLITHKKQPAVLYQDSSSDSGQDEDLVDIDVTSPVKTVTESFMEPGSSGSKPGGARYRGDIQCGSRKKNEEKNVLEYVDDVEEASGSCSSPELASSQIVEEFISTYESGQGANEGQGHVNSEEDNEDPECEIDSPSQSQDRVSSTMRGSDWLRHTDVTTPTKPETSAGVEDGSAKKNKRNRFVKGGMAEQLHKLMMRQRSAERFHVHTLDSQKGRMSVRKLAVSITSVTSSLSLAVVTGRVMSTDENRAGERVTIMIDKTRADELKLSKGGAMVVLPPWHKLELSSGRSVLLCTLSSSVLAGDQISSQSSQSQSQGL